MKFFSQKILALSFVAAMFMVALEVSPWISVFSFCILLWKWGAEKYSWKPMPRRLSGVLSVLILGQVLLQYRTLIGQEPAYTFLLGLAALRVMDYQGARDHKFVVLLGFLLVSIKALFSVDIYWMIPSMFVFFGLWYSLLPMTMERRAQNLVKIMVLSLPLTAVLFVAFPRVVMPWAMSRGSSLGQIGFTDELNPGRVAEIAATTQLAFRAKLSELDLKKSEDLYWRGVVLTQSRGLSWRQGKSSFLTQQRPEGSGVPYDVALEPTAQSFLFVLDGTTRLDMDPPGAMRLENSIFRATRPLHKASVYRGYWNSEAIEEETQPENFVDHPDLQGRVLEWVNEARHAAQTPKERLEKLKELFSETGFTYSLKPGTYAQSDLENFLFVRKVGFCEHFAGAYATLARALDIPARVVVGYQGGMYNPLGDFWKIGQKDAHAWVEIVQNGHWVRIDPTVWVAPLRLIIGAEAFFELSEADQKAFARRPDWRPPQQSASWTQDIGFWVENLNYRWSYFLMEFDRSSQQSLWQDLFQSKFVVFLGILISAVFMLMVFRSLHSESRVLSLEEKLLLAVESWGEKSGASRAVDEAPLVYLERLMKLYPEVQSVLSKVSVAYDLGVYQEKSQAESKQLLSECKKALKPVR